MKHGFITLHQSRKERQLSGEERAKAGQSVRRHNSQQANTEAMTSVFWDMHGIVLIEFLPKGQTINSDYITLLDP